MRALVFEFTLGILFAVTEEYVEEFDGFGLTVDRSMVVKAAVIVGK